MVEIERSEDERGFFARSWCQMEFGENKLENNLAQGNIAFNHLRGTLRGMHFQKTPFEEVKLVRCTMGALFDVAIDLRPDSPTHKKWIGVELSASNRRMLYVPKGFAHGYQTLQDNTEIFYHTSQFYHPESAWGVRHNDQAFGIQWPLEVSAISKNDVNWPDYVV